MTKKTKWVFSLTLIVAAGVVVLVFVLLRGEQSATFVASDSANSSITSIGQPKQPNNDGQLLSHSACTGSDKQQLTHTPMNPSDVAHLIPYGLMTGAHVTPVDHQYFTPADINSPRDAYPVYAAADALLVDVQERTTDRGIEYRLVFSMSCNLFYYYDLVTSLAPKIEAAVKEQQHGIALPVKAGQEIGRIGGQTLDFAVWDMDEYLNFVVPEHYETERWKIHTVDPLDYYASDVKAQILPLYLRKVEPISGKIDYDIDGRLVGNWFMEDTNGYAGVEGAPGYEYANTHLSIGYDHLDPTSIVVSIGNYEGQPAQFAVLGNTPDPADISVASGAVRYELVQQDWADALTGQYWGRSTIGNGVVARNGTEVLGTVLIQMLEARRIKVQAFPGQTSAQVTGFTEAAVIYER